MDKESVLLDSEDRMDKALGALDRDFSRLRTGRASTGLVDNIKVDYYGTPTPINQIAAVSVAEARVLAISPWDASMMGAIERAILTSDIGINPTNDGRVMRLVFPAPTEERRRQLTKDVQKLGEETKVAVRNVRREAMDKFKSLKKNSEITEDDQKNLEEEMQKITDKFVKQIDKDCEAKNKEIMEI